MRRMQKMRWSGIALFGRIQMGFHLHKVDGMHPIGVGRKLQIAVEDQLKWGADIDFSVKILSPKTP